MKALPLALTIVLSSLAADAGPTGFATLSGIDDAIELTAGETALVVGVSEPVYISVDYPQRHRLGIRLRPENFQYLDSYARSGFERREVSEVSWNRPFPISGPCTIRLGTAALMTVRVVGPAS